MYLYVAMFLRVNEPLMAKAKNDLCGQDHFGTISDLGHHVRRRSPVVLSQLIVHS